MPKGYWADKEKRVYANSDASHDDVQSLVLQSRADKEGVKPSKVHDDVVTKMKNRKKVLDKI